MFKKRSLQVKVVKDQKTTGTSSTTTGHWHLEPEQINTIAKDQVLNTGIVVVGALAILKIVDAACIIAVNAAANK